MADQTETDATDVADDWAAALAEQADAGDDSAAQAEAQDATAAPETPPPEAAELEEFAGSAVTPGNEDANLDVILDIPVTISMEIGRTHISIRNLLQLNQGSVVELDRLAGEPMDVLVNGTLIAHGEVVVVNEKFGIRLTDVISATERIKKLK
jgi:flagellar motor switch protein FliN/FliY